ncbi:MerR family transcriptional regulator [Amycolatopsis sp. NPDC004079]|uniref:MerR family transcriptional regulator n=1 Tax=Amycolatopsis sp. NPDC004079 TaxID=3154549 RepID=UPI0033AB1208
MLRHYHQAGLLEPADVDPDTGYRRYTADQLPAAQVIRRFRELGMPLEEIRAVLAAQHLNHTGPAGGIYADETQWQTEASRSSLPVPATRLAERGWPRGLRAGYYPFRCS